MTELGIVKRNIVRADAAAVQKLCMRLWAVWG